MLLPGVPAVARDTDIPVELQISVQAAAEGCPTDAISLQ